MNLVRSTVGYITISILTVIVVGVVGVVGAVRVGKFLLIECRNLLDMDSRPNGQSFFCEKNGFEGYVAVVPISIYVQEF